MHTGSGKKQNGNSRVAWSLTISLALNIGMTHYGVPGIRRLLEVTSSTVYAFKPWLATLDYGCTGSHHQQVRL